jgi:hypothetical protein
MEQQTMTRKGIYSFATIAATNLERSMAGREGSEKRACGDSSRSVLVR